MNYQKAYLELKKIIEDWHNTAHNTDGVDVIISLMSDMKDIERRMMKESGLNITDIADAIADEGFYKAMKGEKHE